MLMSNMGGKLAILAVVPKALTGKVSAMAWSSKAGDVLIHGSSIKHGSGNSLKMAAYLLEKA